MILGFELTIFLYIVLAALFWIIRFLNVRVALGVVLIANGILLAIANTLLLLYLVGQICLVLLLYLIVRSRPSLSGSVPWFAFIGLVPMNMSVWFGERVDFAALAGDVGTLRMPAVFWTLGASFFVVKSFVVLKEAIAAKEFNVLPALVGLTFVPSFSAGPIHGSGTWNPTRLSSQLSIKDVANIVMMLGWGGAAFYVIAPWLREVSGGLNEFPWGIAGQIYLNFAALFFDFSGYTLMAIACAGLFGARLPHNFNRPYLATSIREFWQRWHMSLSWFVSTYLFKPFVRKTGSPSKGIFLAFVCVGLWHEATLGYLLWGIGHGAALSLAMKPPEIWTKLTASLPIHVRAFIGWFLTMTWVAVLSYSATEMLVSVI